MNNIKRSVIAGMSAICFLFPILSVNTPKYTTDNMATTFTSTPLYTTEGKLRVSDEPTDQSLVDSFINTIISKGSEAITGGIQVYAKYIVLNLLKECGLDFRDATTKTLENIQKQLNIIETKIDAIAAKQAQYHAEDILNPILELFATANIRYMNYVSGSLAYLAELENDDTLDEDEIEAKRVAAYNDGINKLMFDGAPFATYVTTLADRVMKPNKTDSRKDIFFYYDQTMGQYDKWDIQGYKNTRNFIAYLDSTLILLSNLAKFQIYYLAKDADTAMRKTYSQMIDDMAIAVNQVNASFAVKLQSMKSIQDNWDRGLNRYIPSNKYYGTRMCTLTYNLEDKGWGDSRQALWLNYYNDYGKHGLHQVAYCYEPNRDIIEAVANDFKSFAGDYCTSAYTIQDYLANAGFWAKNSDKFDASSGLFAGNMYVDKHGFMNDDFDYSLAYYDNWGNFRRKNAYEVASYHTWYGVVDYTELRSYDKNYYLCFITANPNRTVWSLDGSYKQTYMYDIKFTVNEAVYYSVYYMDFVNKPGPITVHEWW